MNRTATLNGVLLNYHHRYLIIMPANNPIIKVARTFKNKFNSLLQTSGPPTPSLIEMDSRPDNNNTTPDAGKK